MFGHFQKRRLVEGAQHDEVDIPRQNARGVGNRFTVTKLHVLARQHHRLATHLAGADIEADPGPGRGLFEDQRDHPAGKRLFGIGRSLGQSLARVLHRAGLVDHRPELVLGCRVNIEKMAHFGSFFGVAGHLAQAPRTFRIRIRMWRARP